MTKDPKKVAMGKKSKAQGAAFENRVRPDLEKQGWTVDRWSNQVDLESSCIVPAKMSWRRTKQGMFPMGLNSGFPDFVAMRHKRLGNYEVIGVEAKMTGKLDKPEKDKCRYLLANMIFSQILIAEKTKVKNRVVIVYHDFEEKYGYNN